MDIKINMQLKNLQNVMSSVVIVSEVGHVFCCVLPTIFSLATVLVGLGVLGAMPVWMNGMHDVMHDWEIPIILMSGFILVLGWGLHVISERLDCHDTGCGHGSCEPKKKKTLSVLKIATALFVINVAIYVSVHIPQNNASVTMAVESEHHDHGHHGHDH